MRRKARAFVSLKEVVRKGIRFSHYVVRLNLSLGNVCVCSSCSYHGRVAT